MPPPFASSGAAISDAIHVSGLRLWAHVGVLEQERQLGQWFELEFWLGGDLSRAAANDDLNASFDYVGAIEALRQLSRTLICCTLEHFSERILSRLEELYGPIPIRLELRKCHAPIPGFDGTVAVCRQRRWS
ncbi:MAG: dihydroneopterin aldolase [Cyanobium sp.]